MKQRRADILVEIDRLAYGGDGVGRDGSGRVVFVPHTAPGDAVRVIVHQESARFAKAKLTSIVTPGTARVKPPCPYVNTCGGCTWQHVSYEAQAEAKLSAASFALRRFVAAGTAIEWVGMKQVTAWRRRARFHFRRTEETFYFGFFAPQTHRVVDISACLQLTPALSQLMGGLRERLVGGRPAAAMSRCLKAAQGSCTWQFPACPTARCWLRS
ncbi:MAG: TRAM domain-containing protein [Myxococcales bacterium]|nr:TRAM domain-containing protein [Myxococcales bacterium]